ncbi:MAG: aldo/keto reductase [Synergistaceae bacterium]|jgi:diketogulonate reductase-like aldo/keto reductase|nr:aldo/keto reductase [Synergistaceae bacterium]
MKALTDSYTLHNGVKIPCVGFGTWQTPGGDVCVSSVKVAIAAGYRHIDTAAVYGNESSVGAAIKQAGVPRGELFITTKLWNEDRGYENTLKAFETSIGKLGLKYLDLYLIHWPNPVKFRNNWQEANAGTWKAFEELYKAGRVRAIGISNFHERHTEPLLKTASVAPMVNQIRLCPGDTQDDVVEYSRKRNMVVEAYSPFGVGEIFGVPEIKAVAEKYGRTVAQVCIRWSLQMGFLPLPKSVTPSRIVENTDVFGFELAEDDVRLIAGLDGRAGYSSDPDKVPF